MKYTIVGSAKSGLAAARLAASKNYDVFLTESKKEQDCREAVETLTKLKVKSEFGAHSEDALKCDVMVVSPGIPPHAEIIQKAEAKGIKIISELEFAWRHMGDRKIIGITGTNGKTTTTSLTEFIFKNAGLNAVAAGNIGYALSDAALDTSWDSIIIAELSSFQLDRVEDFRPDIAMILNITPDHIYYHGSFENYKNAKYKISSRQNENNLLILNGDDKETHRAAEFTKAKTMYFSDAPVDWGIYLRDGLIKINYSGIEEDLMLVNELGLPGIHNRYNSYAAALAARAFEIRNENIRDSLMKFKGVEHRLEFVRIVEGVEFVNDSKATNINATWYALSSYKKPLVWIAGGRGDNNDYSALDDLVRRNVKSIIAIGEEQEAIFNHFCSSKRVVKAIDMQDAVEKALAEANEGEIALFSPACKSFDMFMNYEHRGEVYKECVNNL